MNYPDEEVLAAARAPKTTKQRADERLAAGKCGRCGRGPVDAENSIRLCARCLDNQRTERAAALKARNEKRLAEGNCARCGRNQICGDSGSRCTACHKRTLPPVKRDRKAEVAAREARRSAAVAAGFCYVHNSVKRGESKSFCEACLIRRANLQAGYRRRKGIVPDEAYVPSGPRKPKVLIEKVPDKKKVRTPQGKPAVMKTKCYGGSEWPWRATFGDEGMWGATEQEAVEALRRRLVRLGKVAA